jgi:Flp pilus assembly pilin Flp
MQHVVRSLKRLCGDEKGGEIIEYALVMGLVVIVAIAMVGLFGAKVLARWTSVNSQM